MLGLTVCPLSEGAVVANSGTPTPTTSSSHCRSQTSVLIQDKWALEFRGFRAEFDAILSNADLVEILRSDFDHSAASCREPEPGRRWHTWLDGEVWGIGSTECAAVWYQPTFANLDPSWARFSRPSPYDIKYPHSSRICGFTEQFGWEGFCSHAVEIRSVAEVDNVLFWAEKNAIQKLRDFSLVPQEAFDRMAANLARRQGGKHVTLVEADSPKGIHLRVFDGPASSGVDLVFARNETDATASSDQTVRWVLAVRNKRDSTTVVEAFETRVVHSGDRKIPSAPAELPEIYSMVDRIELAGFRDFTGGELWLDKPSSMISGRGISSVTLAFTRHPFVSTSALVVAVLGLVYFALKHQQVRQTSGRSVMPIDDSVSRGSR